MKSEITTALILPRRLCELLGQRRQSGRQIGARRKTLAQKTDGWLKAAVGGQFVIRLAGGNRLMKQR